MVTHRHLTAALALGLSCAVFTGAASAGGGKSGDAPGQDVAAQTPAAAHAQAPATPPGQEQKAANAPAPQSQGKSASAPGHTKPAGSKAAQPSRRKSTAARAAQPSKGKSASAPGKTKPAGSKAARPTTANRPSVQTPSRGRSAEAHQHVIVCHRTGSSSNPYVVINIPMTAWNEAHKPGAGHPTLDGRDDILLGNALRPGAKILANGQAVDKSMCVAGGNPPPPPGGDSKKEEEKEEEKQQVVLSTTTTTTTTTTEQAAVAAQEQAAVAGAQAAAPERGGVAGVEATLPQQAGKAKPAGGVLGEIAEIGRTELPFTGLPLWLAVVIGLALTGGGVGIRRALR